MPHDEGPISDPLHAAQGWYQAHSEGLTGLNQAGSRRLTLPQGELISARPQLE